MRRRRPPSVRGLFFLASSALALACPAHAELPALLREAFSNARSEEGYWAYTETTVSVLASARGEIIKSTETIVRFDPSKPYAEQYVPQVVDGHAPTAKDLKKYRQMGEDRGDRLLRAEKIGGKQPPAKFSLKADEELAKIFDLDRIAVQDETATAITYSLPYRKGLKAGLFKERTGEVLMRVDKQEKILSHTSWGLGYNPGRREVDTARVDPKYGPVLTKFVQTYVFIKGATSTDTTTRTDYLRVTPYGDRFETSIGPLKALGF